MKPTSNTTGVTHLLLLYLLLPLKPSTLCTHWAFLSARKKKMNQNFSRRDYTRGPEQRWIFSISGEYHGLPSVLDGFLG